MIASRCAAALVALVAVCTASAGCTGSGDEAAPNAAASASAAAAATSAGDAAGGATDTVGGDAAGAAALPAGALVELVPSVAELPPGFTVVDGAAGPVDAGTVAELATDPARATTDLQANRFRDGYAAEYGNEQTGAFVSVLVLRYADAEGARSDFARLSRAVGAAQPLAAEPVGDESQFLSEKLTEGDVPEVVSLRLRVGELVWLIETGGQPGSDAAVARDLAQRLVRRTA